MSWDNPVGVRNDAAEFQAMNGMQAYFQAGEAIRAEISPLMSTAIDHPLVYSYVCIQYDPYTYGSQEREEYR